MMYMISSLYLMPPLSCASLIRGKTRKAELHLSCANLYSYTLECKEGTVDI
jgi:hypothetical protein